MNILLLMMGGSGNRTGRDIPKQYLPVGGRPIFSYILEKYARQEFVDKIILISNTAWLDFVQDWADRLAVPKIHAIVAGGENRSASVYNGLKACNDIAVDSSVVLIHDTTHPYVDVDRTLAVINKTKECGAATLGNFNYDTIYRIDDKNSVVQVLPRTHVINGASPEAFLFGVIFPIYANATSEELASMTSAGAIALQHNIEMAFVQTDILNLKITFEHDLDLFHLLLNYYFSDHQEATLP